MGNIQPAHQQSTRLRAVNPKQQGRKPAPPHPVNPVLAFIQKYPLLIFSGISVGLLLLATWAIMHLFYLPEEKVEPAPSPTSVAVENPTPVPAPNSVPSSKSEETFPVGWVGAIAFSGIVGSWLVLRKLKRPKRRRLVQQQLKPRPTSQRSSLMPQRSIQSTRSAESTSRTSQRRIAPRRPANPPIPTLNNRPIPPINVASAMPKPSANDDSGLAERMDMRKRQSLSSILRNR